MMLVIGAVEFVASDKMKGSFQKKSLGVENLFPIGKGSSSHRKK